RYGTTAELIEALRPLGIGASFTKRASSRAGTILGSPLSGAPDGLRGLRSGGSSPGFKPSLSNPGTKPAGSLSNPGTKPAGSLSNPGVQQAGSLSDPGTKSISTSTPTPRPQNLGSLPTRNSIRGMAKPEPIGEPKGYEPESSDIPGDSYEEEADSWE